MQHDGEVELGGCSVEWLQCWVVERHADWRVDHQPPGPVGAAPAADLNKGAVYVSGAGQDYAAEPVRVSAAIFGHPAVIGTVHRHFESHVVARCPGAKPARGERQVYVDTLMIHVLDPLAGISIDERRWLTRPLHAGEARHVPARRLVGFGRPEAATIAALTLGIGLVSVAVSRLVCLPTTQPVPFSLAEITG